MSRIRVALAVGVMTVLIAILAFGRMGEESGIPLGHALDAGAGAGIAQPLAPGKVVGVGIVSTRNVSEAPVELVRARILRLDPELRSLGFRATPFRSGVPATALFFPFDDQSVELDRFPLLPPAEDDLPQVVVSFGLRPTPGGMGKAVGVEVVYRQRSQLFRQVFRSQVLVCETPTPEKGCPGIGHDYDSQFGDFDEEVAGTA